VVDQLISGQVESGWKKNLFFFKNINPCVFLGIKKKRFFCFFKKKQDFVLL